MIETTSCPQCGAPAEVLDRDVLESTDGPVEHARVVCIARHRFHLPVAHLARLEDLPVRADAPSPAARRSPQVASTLTSGAARPGGDDPSHER